MVHTKITQVVLLLVLVFSSIVYANQDQSVLYDTSAVNASIVSDFVDADGDIDADIVTTHGSLQLANFPLLSVCYYALFTISLFGARALYTQPLVRAPPLSC